MWLLRLTQLCSRLSKPKSTTYDVAQPFWKLAFQATFSSTIDQCLSSAAVLFATCLATDGDQLVASINQIGIKGSVKFEQFNSSTVKVSVNLSYSGVDNKVITIYENPTNYQDKCTKRGREFYRLTAYHGHFQKDEVFYDSLNITLRGPRSFQGRSLVISNLADSKLACGTILSTGADNKYAVVTISNAKIAGKIELIQQGFGDTIITGQLSHSDGATVANNDDYNFYIINKLGNHSMVPQCPSTFDTKEIYNPDQKSGSCTPSTQKDCKIGDLTSKNGNIKIGVLGSERFTMVDSNLPLHGESVLDRYLVVTKGSTVAGCGIVRVNGPLQAESTFKAGDHEGVYGNIKFSQDSPYHATKLEVDLKGLHKKAGGYHVHKYPISDTISPCSAASVGGHLNPHSIVSSQSPPTGTGTMDQYEIGDISNKFGSLVNQTEYELEEDDQNLPMFGLYTMIGRSIVIHNSDATSSRMVCSDIIPKDSVKLSGYLNFTEQDETLDGYVSMFQYKLPGNIMTDTMLIAEVYIKSDRSSKSLNHNYHVHSYAIGTLNNTGTCKSVDNHYNPTDVSVVKPPYSNQCKKAFPYRCELGDTSAKVGTYDIGGGKNFYAVEDSPLYGPHSVLGRSIVFHKAEQNASRLGCADIVPVVGATAKMYSIEGRQSVADHNRLDTMANIISSKLGWTSDEKKWKISYAKISNSTTDSKCYRYSFYLIDVNPQTFENRIKELAKEKKLTFTPCKEEDKSSSITTTSSFTLIATIISMLYFGLH